MSRAAVKPAERSDVVITGFGMRTAVGNDAVQTCATVRTGLSRFAQWPYMGIGLDEDGLTVAAMDPELGDAAWAEKWQAMAAQPVHEALWQAGLHDGRQWRAAAGASAKLGVWLATPSVTRPGVDEEMEADFLAAVQRECVEPAQADAVQRVPLDHAAGLVGVARAMDALQRGLVSIAVVIGVDSQLSSPWLSKLDEIGALKTSMRGVGLIPGEAAGVVVLELRSHAQRRGAKPRLTMGTLAIDHEDVPMGPDHPIAAMGLSRAVKACLQTANDGADIDRVVGDLNGERWRALEWSLVETRCLRQVQPGWALWHPADCYGDVGAATGTLSLGLAATAYERGYGGSGSMLLVAASRSGERVAAIVGPPSHGA